MEGLEKAPSMAYERGVWIECTGAAYIEMSVDAWEPISRF